MPHPLVIRCLPLNFYCSIYQEDVISKQQLGENSFVHHLYRLSKTHPWCNREQDLLDRHCIRHWKLSKDQVISKWMESRRYHSERILLLLVNNLSHDQYQVHVLFQFQYLDHCRTSLHAAFSRRGNEHRLYQSRINGRKRWLQTKR